MKYIIKEMSDMEKPREKLLAFGPNSLTDYELLAILLRTGTKEKSVIDVSIELTKILNSINDLQNITIEELTSIKGIGKTKAIELLATIELGKRLNNFKKVKNRIKCAKDCFEYLKNKMMHLQQENFVAIYLSINNEVITDKIISVGTLNQTIANPRDVIRWGIKYNAYAIIIAHNHPSGDSNPSKEDCKFTLLLNDACKSVDLRLVDHIIIGKNNYYSFKEKRIFIE